jgi:hypothetical protein
MKFIQFVFLIFLLVFSVCLKAQKINSPAEIIEILNRSSLTYELKSLDKSLIKTRDISKVNYNQFYKLRFKDDSYDIVKYQFTDEIKELLKQADAFFKESDFENARKKYFQILETDKTFYQVYPYIGQTYALEKNHQEAILWYEEGMNINNIDYLNYWFLAESYVDLGEKNLALRNIIKALILNRNNPRILNSFSSILRLNNLKFDDWMFNPQYELFKKDEKTILVSFDNDWLGYALAKAIWQYEPNYKSERIKQNQMIVLMEEKEALLGVLVPIYEKKPENLDASLQMLLKAVNNKKLDEYIFFEIILPETPEMAYHLEPSFIDKITDYVINFRLQ